MLKDIPRWWNSLSEVQQWNSKEDKTNVPMPKRKVLEVPMAAGDIEGSPEEDDVEIFLKVSFGKRLTRPQGNKAAKEEQRLGKQREHAVRAQAQAIAEMAAANMRKAQILHD